jgi:fucose permease
MAQLSMNSSWILIYMSCIMVILRLCAGPIVNLLSPAGVLALSSVMAAAGLLAFAQLGGVWLFLAATLFGIGITFLWPAMLGITAEQFPKGGALSLNMITAVGQLSAGILGAALLGYMQDTNVEKTLLAQQPALHAQVVTEKRSVIGGYKTADPERVAGLPEEQKLEIGRIRGQAQKTALQQEAVLPLIMLVCYLLLLWHFRRQGGYREVSIQRE